MPIYEYQCQKCDAVFEVMQKVSDPPPKSHSCGSRRVKRVMSHTSFQLKGDGWYITDYARKGQKNGKDAAAAPGGGESKSDKSDGKQKEAKKDAPAKASTQSD